MFSDIGDALDSIGDFFALILDPQTYVRIFLIVFGVFLIFGALKYGR